MAGPMNFLLELKPDKTGRFTLLADEIGLQGYASFTGLQLIIGKEQQNNTGSWTVSFTNKRLLMISQKVSSNEVTGLTLDRQFIREIKDCPGGLIKASKRVRLVIKGVNSPEEAFFELRFPEEDVTELKQSFLNVLKIVDLCLAYDSIEKFKELLKSNEALVNMPIDSKMNTLLIMACARNNSAVAMHLLQCEGIRSDTINKVTRTPVKRDGKMAEEVCGALYYACINGMEEVVEKLLSIPTADANILFSNEYTGLQYAILKDKECSTSNTNSKISYTKVISMLMSSRKTTWKIADDDEEHYSIPAEWILKTSYDTQRVILHCSRANELPVDLRQKLKASIQKMETKSTSFKSLNGEILRSNSSLTLISNITDDMESSSKICKSESTQSLSSKVNSSSVVNIDSIVEEINQCKSFFERLELPSTLQLAFVILKMLEIDEGITRARSLKLHKTTSQLSKQKKEWKTWKEQISVSIEKQLPLPLTGEGFEGIKIYLLAEIENLSQYHIDKGADEDVFEGLEQFKDQVEGLVLPSTGKQSTGKLEGTAGATSSAVVYPTFPLPPDKTSHVFISHAWAEDEEGRDNHQRVKYLNDILKKLGIITWFDDDRIRHDTSSLREILAQALYSSCCVLICLTKKYEEKVNKGDESDNCLYEFNAAAHCELASKRMTAVMEWSMLNSAAWGVRLKAELRGKLYTDLSSNINFEENCEQIVQNIIKMLQLS